MKLEIKPGGSTSMAPEEVDRLRAAVMRLSRDLRRNIGSAGLTPTESSVLGAIMRAEELGLTELATSEALNPTMLSRVIGSLEQRDLVMRIKDANDRRAGRVRVTAQGKRLIQRLRTRRSEELTSRMQDLSEQDMLRLLDALPALETMARIHRTAE